MILFHVSINSSVEVRVCQKLPAYVPLQKSTKIVSTMIKLKEKKNQHYRFQFIIPQIY